jgi:hypothetical protein
VFVGLKLSPHYLDSRSYYLDGEGIPGIIFPGPVRHSATMKALSWYPRETLSRSMTPLPTVTLISHAMLALRHFGEYSPLIGISTHPLTLQSASGILEVFCRIGL